MEQAIINEGIYHLINHVIGEDLADQPNINHVSDTQTIVRFASTEQEWVLQLSDEHDDRADITLHVGDGQKLNMYSIG